RPWRGHRAPIALRPATTSRRPPWAPRGPARRRGTRTGVSGGTGTRPPPLPFLADRYLLAQQMAGRFVGGQLRGHTFGIGPEEGRERQLLAGLHAKPALVGRQHPAHRLADGIVVIEVKHWQRLRCQVDLQAVPPVLPDGAV